MQVPFHLRRRAGTGPVSALLLFSTDPADLFALYSDLGCDPLPEAFAVADGFVVRLSQHDASRLERRLPSRPIIRLRALADNLFVPVDAELLPALLPDEAADLVRDRGLVFLPGDRVLEFDTSLALSLPPLLTIPGLEHRTWEPLPELPPLAEGITEIVLERPEFTPDEILDSGLEGEGATDVENASDESSLPQRTLGKGMLGAGKFMAFLGKMLGWKGLARRGMHWMESALNWAPGLAKSVFTRQEATLRELLRKFQEGKIEEALRRALPLDGSGRGATPTTSSALPINNIVYSLRNILGASGGGAGIWMTDAHFTASCAASICARPSSPSSAAIIAGRHSSMASCCGTIVPPQRCCRRPGCIVTPRFST